MTVMTAGVHPPFVTGCMGNAGFLVEPQGVDIRRDLFDRLAARKWALMGLRSMEMTLEEIFIYELGGTGYDVKNLVL